MEYTCTYCDWQGGNELAQIDEDFTVKETQITDYEVVYTPNKAILVIRCPMCNSHLKTLNRKSPTFR